MTKTIRGPGLENLPLWYEPLSATLSFLLAAGKLDEAEQLIRSFRPPAEEDDKLAREIGILLWRGERERALARVAARHAGRRRRAELLRLPLAAIPVTEVVSDVLLCNLLQKHGIETAAELAVQRPADLLDIRHLDQGRLLQIQEFLRQFLREHGRAQKRKKEIVAAE